MMPKAPSLTLIGLENRSTMPTAMAFPIGEEEIAANPRDTLWNADGLKTSVRKTDPHALVASHMPEGHALSAPVKAHIVILLQGKDGATALIQPSDVYHTPEGAAIEMEDCVRALLQGVLTVHVFDEGTTDVTLVEGLQDSHDVFLVEPGDFDQAIGRMRDTARTILTQANFRRIEDVRLYGDQIEVDLTTRRVRGLDKDNEPV
jgi:hypothetical protein